MQPKRKKTGKLLRLTKINFEDDKLPYKLFLTTRQTTATINIFANNMSTDMKLSKAQISKIIQSGGSFGSWLANVGKKALTSVAIPLARDNLYGLVRSLTSSAINKFDRKISGKELPEQEKGLLYLFQLKIWLILLKL